MTVANAPPPRIEVWGGLECTIARVGDSFRDQIAQTGHRDRPGDLDKIAALGLRTLRYPILWEQVAPDDLAQPRWEWHDSRLARLRELGIAPIAGLLHHGSGPRYTDLLDPRFPGLLAEYAEMVARRYPDIAMFTPVNEPLTTARFSCLYGHWYPHRKDVGAFLLALYHQCLGVALAMRAIRRVTPGARLVQTEDVGRVFSTPALRGQAEYENARRWLGFDLLCGRVNRRHDWFARFVAAGVPERGLLELADDPSPPDIMGVNYYLTSDRFLDSRLRRYAPTSWGGNGSCRYADVEAVRIARADIRIGVEGRLREIWQRYGRPVAVTETHNGCTREEQLRWLVDAYNGAERLRRAGADVRAVTVWALMGAIDWDSLLTREQGHWEVGAFDARRRDGLRPTALAKATAALATSGSYQHPVLGSPGWWRRDDRYFTKPRRTPAPARPEAVPLLITGASGTLGRAFARVAGLRGLPYRLTSRADLDIADPLSVAAALESRRPWAVINTAGYVRVADAEHEPERCYRENSEGAETLARACARLGIPLVTFSSDLVFDGFLGRAYIETDSPTPRCVYGASKAEAERRVLQACPDALVIRTSAFFGPWDPHNFVYHTLRALARGEAVVASADRRVSPTYVPDLVDSTLDLLIDGESGIWHLANQGAVSWAELARLAAKAAGLDASRVIDEAPRTEENNELGSLRGRLLPPLVPALDRFLRESVFQH
ncbi:MAG: sugar nucleotide-binding protein [Alphaproteobacteria bacterium]|nr:sugar nucleotide-binding protein [Alphaproteobacteria bacterium]